MRNEIIYRKCKDGRLLLNVPTLYILYKYHNEVGHIDRHIMLDVICKSYWFPNAKDKCLSHIEYFLYISSGREVVLNPGV